MSETTTMPEVLTLEDAAHFLKLAPEAVARQAEAGQIPGRRVEGSWRFLLSRLEDWLGRRDSKAIFLEQAGAFKADESMDELVAQIYNRRAVVACREMVEGDRAVPAEDTCHLPRYGSSHPIRPPTTDEAST